MDPSPSERLGAASGTCEQQQAKRGPSSDLQLGFLRGITHFGARRIQQVEHSLAESLPREP